jgi:hypothetical protein
VKTLLDALAVYYSLHLVDANNVNTVRLSYRAAKSEHQLRTSKDKLKITSILKRTIFRSRSKLLYPRSLLPSLFKRSNKKKQYKVNNCRNSRLILAKFNPSAKRKLWGTTSTLQYGKKPTVKQLRSLSFQLSCSFPSSREKQTATVILSLPWTFWLAWSF